MIIKSAKAYCLMEYWSDNFLELTITEAFKEGILVFSSLLPFFTFVEKNTDPETLKKQKELYSFDETECYNLPQSFMEWLNSRVKRYDEVNIINTSFYKFQIDGKEMTQQECMDSIIKTTENILTNRALPVSEYFDKVKDYLDFDEGDKDE